MAFPLEMYSKFGVGIGFVQPNGANWSENGQWPTDISSSAYVCTNVGHDGELTWSILL